MTTAVRTSDRTTPGLAVPAPAGDRGDRADRRGTSPGQPTDDRSGQPPGPWSTELALTVLGLAGLLGFHRVFTGGTWLVPVIGTATGVALVCRFTRRWIANPLMAAAVDLASVAALVAWTVAADSTDYGLPGRATWHLVATSLTGIGDRMQSATVPVDPVTGYLLLAAAGAGTVALTGSWICFRLGRPLAACLPSLAAMATCSGLGARRGREWSVALEVAAAVLFVLVERSEAQRSGPWLGSAGAVTTARAVRTGVPAVALAAVVALAVTPQLHGPDGHGPLGWRTGGGDPTRIVVSPLVSLSTRLLHQSGTDVFTVESPVPSYWRLTSLDDFDGVQWNARDTYQDVDRTLPGVPGRLRGARTVVEHFGIQNLESVWLPLAFDPQAVSGAGKVSYDPRSGSLLTAHATSDRLRYTVSSVRDLDTLSARSLAAVAMPRRTAALDPYLQLPGSVPPAVVALAKKIVGARSGEYAQALALQQFFYGPSFHYSLRPPADGAGNGALETFLFHTRTGYCQQFAGAYAVLARAVGLPTRLAIGFTAGRVVGHGRYQVTDADAHTWPEVWFAPVGWVPFEPTKGTTGSTFAIPGATAYTGDTAAAAIQTGHTQAPTKVTTPTAPVTTPTTTVTATGHHTAPQVRSHVGGSSSAASARTVVSATVTPPSAHSGHGYLVALGLAVAAVALLVLNRLGRRWRWARRRARDIGRRAPGVRYGPAAMATLWDETAERLAWRGIRRSSSETPHQFVTRISLERRSNGEAALGIHLLRLADILREAEFGPDGVSSDDLDDADRRGGRVEEVLRNSRSRTERLRIAVDPRTAWSPVTVTPSGAPMT